MISLYHQPCGLCAKQIVTRSTYFHAHQMVKISRFIIPLKLCSFWEEWIESWNYVNFRGKVSVQSLNVFDILCFVFWILSFQNLMRVQGFPINSKNQFSLVAIVTQAIFESQILMSIILIDRVINTTSWAFNKWQCSSWHLYF